jgi:eukaryotic-like serine/threonine-protein kinase
VRPFRGATRVEILYAVLHRHPEPLESLCPELPLAVSAVIARCLQKAPAERFSSGGELLAALEAAPPVFEATSSRPKPAEKILTLSDMGTALGATAASDGPPRASSSAGPARRRVRTVWRFAAVALALAATTGAWRWRARGAALADAPSASASAPGSAAPSSSEGLSRSPSPPAQRLFEEAMRSFHDGTGQAVSLLQSTVNADPGFGGAYLRLWWLTKSQRAEGHEHTDEYRRRIVALQSTLSMRDREFFDCAETTDLTAANTKLDAYLSRYPDDGMAWVARLDVTPATTARALAADPTLVPVVAYEASALLYLAASAERVEEAATVVARCIDLSPRSADCLGARVLLLDLEGNCKAGEADARKWLELQPDATEARGAIAGFLAAQGAPVEAVREVLKDDLHAYTSATIIPGASVAMMEGDFWEVERLAAATLEAVASSATQIDHVVPVATLIIAYAESGDTAAAGRVAESYLARRVAWKEPSLGMQGMVVAAAARADYLDQRQLLGQLDALFQASVDAGSDPIEAWVSAYAAGAFSRAEALYAVAKLDALKIATPPMMWPTAYARVLFLAGRVDVARRPLENLARTCSLELANTPGWARAHLYLGEIEENQGHKAAACDHYAKVIGRWGHAKPRSVTADDARMHAKALACLL